MRRLLKQASVALALTVMFTVANAASPEPAAQDKAVPEPTGTGGAVLTQLPADSLERMAAAHLELDSTYLDLGEIERDSIGTGVMTFRNTGDAPLVISRIFTECGCTVPEFSRRAVAPGETGKITVRFKTKGRVPGFFRKTLRVRSNADNPRVVFAVKGYVKKAQ